MKPPAFAYHAVRSAEETVGLLAEVGDEGKILAGGQSLIPVLNMRLVAPAHVIDINRVPGWDTIEVDADTVTIGALVRHAELEAHDAAYAAQPLLRQALRHVAHPAIRNRGTTVGSLAHADPAGEMPAILALCDGSVVAASARGERTIPAADFFLGPLESCLEADEVLVSASFRRFPSGTGSAYAEISRRSGDYALVGVGAAVTVEDQHVTRARVGLVSVHPLPLTVDVTEVLRGNIGDLGRRMDEAVALVRDSAEPEADIHATAAYRSQLCGVLTKRALLEAAAAVGAATGRSDTR